MKILGLCGGSGSGKGYVSRIFASYGIPSIDTDEIYRELTSQCSDCLLELSREFGEKIITKDGALDRAAMRALAFSGDNSEYNRKRLNEIAHKHVLASVRERLNLFSSKGVEAVLVDAPLLFESGFDKECDKIICVSAPTDLRVRRIMERDGIAREAALARISAQLSDSDLAARSDFLIRNDGDCDRLYRDIAEILAVISEK